MSHKNRLHKKAQAEESQDMSLNIASMADIFVVLLVFLLKTVSGAGAGVAPQSAITLPIGRGGGEMIEALRLEISPDVVLVDGKPAVTMKNFQLASRDSTDGAKIAPLIDALKIARGRQLASVSEPGPDGKKVDPKITVMIDQLAPYSLIKSILASAATVGYSNFKLVVLKEQ